MRRQSMNRVMNGFDRARAMNGRSWIPAAPRIAVIGVVAALLAAGCHREAPPGQTTVRGHVSFQGGPLAGGRVVFAPDRERGGAGKPISAEIAGDGRFHLGTGEGPAIPSGWYRVAIAPSPQVQSQATSFPPSLARPDRSGLIREVRPGQDNVFDFLIETAQ
jgi:hypothetical protein